MNYEPPVDPERFVIVHRDELQPPVKPGSTMQAGTVIAAIVGFAIVLAVAYFAPHLLEF